MTNDFGNKKILSENLTRYVTISGKTRREIANELGVKESSFNGWCRGEYYPRIDKVEMLADYFGCTKSDLIERKEHTFIVTEEVKKALEDLRNDKKRKELAIFVAQCSDKEADLLLQFVHTLKGSDES